MVKLRSSAARTVVCLAVATVTYSLCSSHVASAQIVATVEDINPDQSSLDPTDPDGASGGRVNGLGSFAGDNTTFYAATERGGLYKTTDAGRNWFRLDRHLPNFTVDVKVDPANINRVYATSFWDGRVNSLAGINVSDDGGTTWTKPATATPDPGDCSNARRLQPSAFGIAIDPADSQNVYIGTNCGLAITNDGGVNWDFVDPSGSGSARNVWDVVVHNGGLIDLCGAQGHWRSDTGGMSWTSAVTGPALPSGRCSIAVSPDESDVLFATVRSAVWESDDAGDSWTNLGTPDSRQQGRIPFVRTNPRSGSSGDDFDLWYGDVRVFRGACTSNPAGGGLRCPMANATPLPNPPPPTPAGWSGPFTRSVGAHDDVGDIVFDSTVAQDGCPVLFSSDGGIYFNTLTTSPGCHTPAWEQPTVTPHATWLWAMAGADQAGDAAEDLYFGLQDNGSFGTTDAGAASPSWTNRDCCDVFDFAAEAARALYTFCCTGPRSTILERRGSGLAGGGAVADPGSYPADGLLPGFIFPDILDRFGPASYVMLTRDCFTPPNGIDDDGDGLVDEPDELRGCTGVNGGDGGVHITTNAGANPITWTELGNATEPPSISTCAVEAVTAGGTSTFYVQSGACDGRAPGQLWRFDGTNPAGAWGQVNLPTGGVGIFAADPNDGERIVASEISGPNSPRMLLSDDGGTSWGPMPELDALMNGSGVFRYRAMPNDGGLNAGGGFSQTQPSLFAFDPDDPNIMVAGGINSGVFVSADGGDDWHLVTDPLDSGNSGTPHIPRPRYAYFDHEPANEVNLYLGSEGRGVWRINFLRPPVADAGCAYTTNEGTPITLNGSGTDGDPGALTLEWDFDGDGLFDDAVGPNPVFSNVAQNGSFPILLRVTDADGATDTDGCDVTVLNVPPSVAAGPDQVGFEDAVIDLTNVTYTDPGVLDTHTAVIDWGDGSAATPGVVTPGAPGSGSVNGSHIYPDPGTYTVTVTVTDSDGDSGSDTKTITVVHGFLQHCLFGFGDRARADRVDIRKGAFGDCSVGANARIRTKRRVELFGGLTSHQHKVRVGKDNNLSGDVEAGANGKVKRRSQITGDVATVTDLRLRRAVFVDGDATAGGLVDVKPTTTVTGTVTSGAAVTPSPSPTEVTVVVPPTGAADVSVGRNETRTLPPGSYGRLDTDAGAVLDLAAGQYQFDDFLVLKDSRIHLDLSGGPVIIDVGDRFRIGRRSRMEITSATGDAADILVQIQGDRRARLKKGGRFLGTYLSPAGDLKLGKWSILTGALYGREANAKKGAELLEMPALDVFVSLHVP